MVAQTKNTLKKQNQVGGFSLRNAASGLFNRSSRRRPQRRGRRAGRLFGNMRDSYSRSRNRKKSKKKFSSSQKDFNAWKQKIIAAIMNGDYSKDHQRLTNEAAQMRFKHMFESGMFDQVEPVRRYKTRMKSRNNRVRNTGLFRKQLAKTEIDGVPLARWMDMGQSIDKIREKAIQLGISKEIVNYISTKGFHNIHLLLKVDGEDQSIDPETGNEYKPFQNEKEVYYALIKWKLNSKANKGICRNKETHKEKKIKDFEIDENTKELIRLKGFNDMKQECETKGLGASDFEWYETTFSMEKELAIRKSIKAYPYYKEEVIKEDGGRDMNFVSINEIEKQVQSGIWNKYDININDIHNIIAKLDGSSGSTIEDSYKYPEKYKQIKEDLIEKFKEVVHTEDDEGLLNPKIINSKKIFNVGTPVFRDILFKEYFIEFVKKKWEELNIDSRDRDDFMELRSILDTKSIASLKRIADGLYEFCANLNIDIEIKQNEIDNAYNIIPNKSIGDDPFESLKSLIMDKLEVVLLKIYPSYERTRFIKKKCVEKLKEGGAILDDKFKIRPNSFIGIILQEIENTKIDFTEKKWKEIIIKEYLLNNHKADKWFYINCDTNMSMSMPGDSRYGSAAEGTLDPKKKYIMMMGEVSKKKSNSEVLSELINDNDRLEELIEQFQKNIRNRPQASAPPASALRTSAAPPAALQASAPPAAPPIRRGGGQVGGFRRNPLRRLSRSLDRTRSSSRRMNRENRRRPQASMTTRTGGQRRTSGTTSDIKDEKFAEKIVKDYIENPTHEGSLTIGKVRQELVNKKFEIESEIKELLKKELSPSAEGFFFPGGIGGPRDPNKPPSSADVFKKIIYCIWKNSFDHHDYDRKFKTKLAAIAPLEKKPSGNTLVKETDVAVGFVDNVMAKIAPVYSEIIDYMFGNGDTIPEGLRNGRVVPNWYLREGAPVIGGEDGGYQTAEAMVYSRLIDLYMFIIRCKRNSVYFEIKAYFENETKNEIIQIQDNKICDEDKADNGLPGPANPTHYAIKKLTYLSEMRCGFCKQKKIGVMTPTPVVEFVGGSADEGQNHRSLENVKSALFAKMKDRTTKGQSNSAAVLRTTGMGGQAAIGTTAGAGAAYGSVVGAGAAAGHLTTAVGASITAAAATAPELTSTAAITQATTSAMSVSAKAAAVTIMANPHIMIPVAVIAGAVPLATAAALGHFQDAVEDIDGTKLEELRKGAWLGRKDAKRRELLENGVGAIMNRFGKLKPIPGSDKFVENGPACYDSYVDDAVFRTSVPMLPKELSKIGSKAGGASGVVKDVASSIYNNTLFGLVTGLGWLKLGQKISSAVLHKSLGETQSSEEKAYDNLTNKQAEEMYNFERLTSVYYCKNKKCGCSLGFSITGRNLEMDDYGRFTGRDSSEYNTGWRESKQVLNNKFRLQVTPPNPPYHQFHSQKELYGDTTYPYCIKDNPDAEDKINVMKNQLKNYDYLKDELSLEEPDEQEEKENTIRHIYQDYNKNSDNPYRINDKYLSEKVAETIRKNKEESPEYTTQGLIDGEKEDKCDNSAQLGGPNGFLEMVTTMSTNREKQNQKYRRERKRQEEQGEDRTITGDEQLLRAGLRQRGGYTQLMKKHKNKKTKKKRLK